MIYLGFLQDFRGFPRSSIWIWFWFGFDLDLAGFWFDFDFDLIWCWFDFDLARFDFHLIRFDFGWIRFDFGWICFDFGLIIALMALIAPGTSWDLLGPPRTSQDLELLSWNSSSETRECAPSSRTWYRGRRERATRTLIEPKSSRIQPTSSQIESKSSQIKQI